MKTDFPWDGKVAIQFDPEQAVRFSVNLRIPGWVKGEPVPGELYRFLDQGEDSFELLVNGEKANFQIRNGYAVIDREWRKGDQITYVLPMEVKEIKSRPEVLANAGRIAIQRGPLVYCIEGADNPGSLSNLSIPQNPNFKVEEAQVLDESILSISLVGLLDSKPIKVTAIPYYTWANRGPNEMFVWLRKQD